MPAEHFPYEHEDGYRDPEAVAWLYNSEGTDRGFLARSLLRLEAELLAAQEREKALREFVQEVALSWHGNDSAKARALNVIVQHANAALAGTAGSPSEKPG